MDSSLRRGSLKIRPRKIIYDGSKTIRKADSLIELVIAHHFKDNCVELVVRDSNNISSDNEVGRIYFDYEKLSQQIDSLRFKRAFEKKMEAFRAQGIETNVDDAATVVMNELLVEYLLAHVSADVDNSNNINSNNSNSNVYPIVHINKITSSMNLLNSISTVTNTITSSIGQTPQVSELIIIINIASNHSLVIESPPIPLTEVYKRIEQRLVSVDNTIIHTSTSNDNSEETTSIIDAILLKPPDTISPLDVTQYRRRKS